MFFSFFFLMIRIYKALVHLRSVIQLNKSLRYLFSDTIKLNLLNYSPEPVWFLISSMKCDLDTSTYSVEL